MTLEPSEPIQPRDEDRDPLDRDQVRAVYQQHAVALQRFLLGILKNEALAADALQSTFVKLIEKGSTVKKQSALKSWMFRVAFNEAMLIRRRQGVRNKHAQGVAWEQEIRLGVGNESNQVSLEELVRLEDVQRVRSALDELSDVQREVVKKRIYEGMKFREIAEQLEVPLGTVLARMQSSLKKLKPILESE